MMPTSNLVEFTANFAKAVFSALAKKESAIKKLLTGIASLRPALTYDSTTGAPEISIKVDNHSEASQSLEVVFNSSCYL